MSKCVQGSTSFGSANIETIAVSIASWFSNLDALAAMSTTISLSTPLANTCRRKDDIKIREYKPTGHLRKQKEQKHHLSGTKNNTSIILLSTVSLLSVKVPVLSLHNTSIPAISSMAVILFVMAPCTV